MEATFLDAVISGRLPSSLVLIGLAVYVVLKLGPELRALRTEIAATQELVTKSTREQADRVVEELLDKRLSGVQAELGELREELSRREQSKPDAPRSRR